MITLEHEQSFRTRGFFVLGAHIDAAALRELRIEIDRLHDVALDDAQRRNDVIKAKEINSRFFQWQVHTASLLCADLLGHCAYLDICHRFIGPDADLFTALAAIKVANGGSAFPWHQDSAYAVTDPLESIVTWTAVDAANIENGCLRVVPGSHRKGLVPHSFDAISIATAEMDPAEENAAVPLEMLPGQTAVFSSLLLHMTGVNHTEMNRRSLVFQFHHPSVVLEKTRQPVGDRHPMLRSGEYVNARPVKGATGVDKYL